MVRLLADVDALCAVPGAEEVRILQPRAHGDIFPRGCGLDQEVQGRVQGAQQPQGEHHRPLQAQRDELVLRRLLHPQRRQCPARRRPARGSRVPRADRRGRGRQGQAPALSSAGRNFGACVRQRLHTHCSRPAAARHGPFRRRRPDRRVRRDGRRTRRKRFADPRAGDRQRALDREELFPRRGGQLP